MTTTVRPDQELQTSEKRDYRGTLNITLNDKDPGAFPQRGNLPAKEPEFQERWDSDGRIPQKRWQSTRPKARLSCTTARPTPTATSIWATR